MKKRCLPTAALLLLGSPPAFTAEVAPAIRGSRDISAPLHVIDPVIVTAARTAQTADETLSSVTVIDREEIERRQAQSVQDLLRGIPGSDIANNGGPGKATSVFLRGTESDHVLVLIDGVKAGSATLGTTAFQDIPIEQIERIEIVRGPRSSLYGSEAIGGVIQIFTRKGGGTLKPFFSIGGGSYQTYSASAGVSGGGERGWFSISASGIDTGGFNACDGKPSPGGAGCFTTEPDKDGYRNVSGSLRAGYRFDNGAEVDVHALRAEGKNEFDGGFVNESESVQQILGSTLRFSPADIWLITLTAGRSRDESDNFKDGTFQSRFDTERDTLSFQNDLSIAPDHLLTVGADYQDDRVDGTTAYAVTSRNNTGLFTQYQGAFGAHDVQLSLRRDDNEQFGNRNTGGAAWGYTLDKNLRLTASYGTAFKAPSFNELYWPYSASASNSTTYISRGNPDLSPEKSKTTELGLRYKPTAMSSVSLSVYETKAWNIITWVTTATGPGEFTTAPTNINRVRIRGFEAVFDTRLADWDVRTSLTLLDPKNLSSSANDGNVLPRRTRQSLRLDADRAFDHYTFGITLLAAGKRYDDLANTWSLSSYTTLDVRAEHALAKDWRVQARVENLIDKNYETAAYFKQPGRSLYLTLRYQSQ